MYVMVLNVLAYAHDALMVTLYYSRTLGRRYSVKITALAAAGWWIVQSAGKLPAMYLADGYNMSMIMVVQCLSMFAYLFPFYRSTLVKKLSAVKAAILLYFSMDLVMGFSQLIMAH